jgi:hypothetical protein
MSRQEKITALRAVPTDLEEALRDITKEELSLSYREGGWSIRQIVHHLADSHLNAYLRIMFMLAEDHPTIKPYDQDVWAALPQYPLDVEASQQIIRGLQSRMADLFDNLSDGDWSRGAYHPERGELTVADMLDIYHDHGRHHIAQIRQARKLVEN